MKIEIGKKYWTFTSRGLEEVVVDEQCMDNISWLIHNERMSSRRKESQLFPTREAAIQSLAKEGEVIVVRNKGEGNATYTHKDIFVHAHSNKVKLLVVLNHNKVAMVNATTLCGGKPLVKVDNINSITQDEFDQITEGNSQWYKKIEPMTVAEETAHCTAFVQDAIKNILKENGWQSTGEPKVIHKVGNRYECKYGGSAILTYPQPDHVCLVWESNGYNPSGRITKVKNNHKITPEEWEQITGGEEFTLIEE